MSAVDLRAPLLACPAVNPRSTCQGLGPLGRAASVGAVPAFTAGQASSGTQPENRVMTDH